MESRFKKIFLENKTENPEMCDEDDSEETKQEDRN